MIVVQHHPVPPGWEFGARREGLSGGGRTLARSIDASEHAARVYLSDARGYPVEHQYARAQVRHTIGGVALTPSSDGVASRS